MTWRRELVGVGVTRCPSDPENYAARRGMKRKPWISTASEAATRRTIAAVARSRRSGGWT
jgi:hypothetical protein